MTETALLAASFALGLGLAAPAAAQDLAAAEAKVPLNPDRNVYFGNFHVHTNYSFDAFANGAITGPDDAYRWARGAPIAAGGGLDATIRIGKPLDWYVVSDHAEYLGIVPKMAEPGNPLGQIPVAKLVTSKDQAEGFEGYKEILLLPDRRRLVAAVTVAHSLSLAAAALGWLVVPAPPVEAMVALSIMFLAAEILRPSGLAPTLSERAPWLVTFAFGLLHGLGFARALLDVGLLKGKIPAALLAFNFGVEAGQLLFIAIVLAAGASLARLYPGVTAMAGRPRGAGVKSAGYLMGGTAAVWFVGRLAAF